MGADVGDALTGVETVEAGESEMLVFEGRAVA